MILELTGSGEAFLLARVLFGVILTFMGLNHLTNAEDMIGYSQAKGIPAAGVLVPATGFQLLAGGLGIAIGAFPVVAAGAIAVFLLVATPTMHDFWAVPEDQQQSEMTNFLKNVALLGGALAFLALGSVEWPYAVGVGLF
ncbi:DoxX family protein [Halapricum hydrolyticum]|uniref:DoxX family protein n=1 Tax=Halapricum hydrolyticum TaxID=2979991 RepID=A0AAE3IAD7_9EURY|nr:DoxX family protein [Halapricum hydrolyticum]MCU4717097.1 DoxX family protein [Halapricum hydrolyticum]MCU4726024.1 DoxX family protein [Halapricum hydrolyticum]